MNNFEIGKKCACVDDVFDAQIAKLYIELPEKDQIYVIRDVRIGTAYAEGKKIGAISLLLIGPNNPHADGAKAESTLSERGFNSDRFRLLDELQAAACKQRKKLVFDTSLGTTDPRPASFYMSYPARQLLMVIGIGLRVYQKPSKK